MPNLPSGQEQRAGLIGLSGRIEQTAPLQQITHVDTGRGFFQGFNLIEDGMPFAKLALQTLGAGQLGEQLKVIWATDTLRLRQ